MPEKTIWSEQRLQLLFDRYNKRYWRGRIPRYSVKIRPLGGSYACCEKARRKILIDVDYHSSDRDVRQTMLHEMAHAAASRAGHGHEFFAQIENLLRKGAPIKVGWTEAHYARILRDVVPARFPLARKAMERVEEARERAVERFARKRNLEQVDASDEEIIGEFADAAMELTWKRALIVVGTEYGLIDDLGRPLSKWAAQIINRAKKAFRRARRDYLEDRRLKAKFEASIRNQSAQVSGPPSGGKPTGSREPSKPL